MILSINKRITLILGITISVLLIPLIGMQFSNEVNWQLNDFVMAAILLFGAGLLIDAVSRNVKVSKYRIFWIIAIIAVFLLVWVELAVGIFGSPLSGS